MIFDFTDLASDVNVRHKPRNHVSIEGHILHGDDIVASLSTLALVYGALESDYWLAGGRFTLAWHKMRTTVSKPLKIIVTVSDDRFDQPIGVWVVEDVSIMDDGIPTALGGFGDLLGHEVAFFGRRI
jgi:hypothetical protein